MTEWRNSALRVPIQPISPRFDVDVAAYSGLNPATYLILALCYDSLAAPSGLEAGDSIIGPTVSPDYSRMLPRLAELFTDEGGGRWSLRLRAGVRSQHGNILCAEDVKRTFDKAFALGTVGAYRWGQIVGLEDSSSVKVTGPSNIEFQLRSPNPHFPSFLFSGTPMVTDGRMLERHAAAHDPWAAEWMAAGNVAGYGAYDLEAASTDEIRFSARSYHWDEIEQPSRVAVTSIRSRRDALKMLDEPEPTYVVGLRSDEALALREKSNIWLNCSWAGHTYVSMNYNRPPFDDIRVRQALSYATPYREVIERGFLGLARPWRSPLSVFDAWYSDEHWTFHTNVSRARELLIEAGYSDGLTLNLYVPLRSDLIRVGELLRAAYALIGVMVELRDMSMVQPGWHPTFYLRAECGHNVNEPVYDIAHDHVLVKPLVNEGAVPEYVDTWFGAYPGSREFEGMYRAILLAPSDAERHWHCEQMQAAVVAAAPIIFLAENLQISAGNSAAPPQLRDFRNRVVQALHYQNANTSYLPAT
jgi:ABC-type transport system substrate-binding protein